MPQKVNLSKVFCVPSLDEVLNQAVTRGVVSLSNHALYSINVPAKGKSPFTPHELIVSSVVPLWSKS